jgi:hypothetical protein
MTTPEPQPSDAKPRIALVCTGKTYLQSGAIGLVFAEVTPEGALGNERIYDQKNLKRVRAGSVYDIEIDPANFRSIYPASIRWLHLWKDEAQIAVWQTLVDAFDTRDLAVKQERKQTGRKLPLERLAPLREHYWSTNSAGRLAIEVRVLAYLRQERIT